MRRSALVLGLLVGLALAPTVGQALHQRASAGAPHPPGVPAAAAPGMSGEAATATAAARDPITGPTAGDQNDDVPVFTHRSARLDDVARTPVNVRIAALGVDAPIIAVGTAPDGQLDVPADGSTVVWYRAGSVPGAAGSAVLAAHVDYAGRPGAFYALDRLAAGDAVRVDFDDGSTATFEVEDRTQYRKQALPVDDLFTHNGDAVLTLITCGGQFNHTTRHYDSNTVVQAALR
jgi:sortase (surface protein transpeptidase)